MLYKRTKERKKKKKKSGLTSSTTEAEALLELSEFSFFPLASESLGRRGYRENVYTARDPS